MARQQQVPVDRPVKYLAKPLVITVEEQDERLIKIKASMKMKPGKAFEMMNDQLTHTTTNGRNKRNSKNQDLQ